MAIPQPEGPAPDRTAWWPNAWFPDGTKFIADAYMADHIVSTWVISVMGGPPRKLRDDADVPVVSPDGTLIAYATGNSAFYHHRGIWLMGAQGEEPRRFVSGSEDDGFWSPMWSPDGQRIVYIRCHRKPDGCAIESRDLKGGQPTVVVSDPRICDAIGSIWWAPGGRVIYTMAEPEPKLGVRDENLWEIRVDRRTGQALGKPRRLTNWPGINGPVCATADGTRLAVMRYSLQADVYVGELEAGGRRLKNARRLTLNENNDLPGRWMLDSKALLFVSDRNGTWDIFKQALDQVEAQPVVTGPDYKQQPVLSPDGSWILYLSTATAQVGPTAPVRIMRVPISGEPSQLVLEGRGMDGLACAQSPATLCAFSEPSPDQKQVVISAFDPVQGRGKELARINLRQPNWGYSWDLSRDGSQLAFTQSDDREGRIQIIRVAGGMVREINLKGWNRLERLSWTADGRDLYVTTIPTSGTMLLYVDLEGRVEVLWQQRLPGAWGTWGVPSPDGRHLALTSYTLDSNVWLLENFEEQ